MKIFITGSLGFIGKEVVHYLEEQGKHEVITFDIHQGQNILDYNALKELMQDCEVVIHLAAIPKPLEEKSFSEYFNINVKGTLNVAKAAFENKAKKLIFISSTSYYGIEQGMPFQKPVKETSPILTQSVNQKELDTRDCDIAYSTSKVMAEQVLANFGLTKKMNTIILRFGPTRPKGIHKPFLGVHLKIENAIQAIVLAIETKKELWYESFTITDELDIVDVSKAKEMLGYVPR